MKIDDEEYKESEQKLNDFVYNLFTSGEKFKVEVPMNHTDKVQVCPMSEPSQKIYY